ncbi:tyrosyl-DNA phosphodiesterase 1-like isoform X2 [Mizuhopecten yessoensis]|uniref:Tyrosyl-DNA phosphodiesterase 1 n=1 Tax=Mizuhopecten yessoensis TaxID=6573 RepID=A0A210PW15_MIZYE|nr:tyrosyl-DNA phosphodiesterase 1-like isoform X2 [Mizuhopecten yessoensis]OWF40656.1 Tyrosyl-DNA phosphodiesterase 1 [Mizuhopecten yessoensis]
MAANFSDEDFARQLQAQFDAESASSLQADLKSTSTRTTSSHFVSDSDSDVTLDPELEQERLTFNIKEKTTPKKSHSFSDSDSDVTLSPDLFDRESPFNNMSNNSRNTKKALIHSPSSSRKNDYNEKQLQRRRSKTHEVSDSEEEESVKTTVHDGNNQRTVEKTPSSQQKSSEKNNSFQHRDSSAHKKANSRDQEKDSSTPSSLKRKRTLLLDEEQSTSKREKPICQYGSKCYRKNPSHREEFHHPVDSRDKQKPSTSSATPPPAKKVKAGGSLAARGPVTPSGVYKAGQPLSFFLTKVHGIENKYNRFCTMDVKDILSPEMGNLTASCQFNYMFEVPWLMKQYPQQFRSKPLLLVHGFKGANKASLEADGAAYSNIRFCQARLDMPYGTHHTKMMFLLYDNGMRVVVHTSNMMEHDWFQKTQGMWISPLFPKLSKPSSTLGESPTGFKRDLLEYVGAYQAYQLKDWKDHIFHHDMSSARVFIVGSCPGRHAGDKKSHFGHMRLRRLLHDHGPEKELVRTWPVLGQYSSVGTLGPAKESWLCTEWLQSLATVKGTSCVPLMTIPLQLIFPTKDDVRTSLEGYPAGGSIPYSIHVARKQPYLHTFLHQWRSEGRGRSRAMPHIKTYGRPSPSGKELAWFLVTSANLSKAAWGAMEKKGSQLMIRSYELGVLFFPKFFEVKGAFRTTSDVDSIGGGVFPLPYDLPVTRYSKGDKPWIWDIAHKELPDTNGNMWCPPGS